MKESGWHDFDTLESYIAKEQRAYPESRGVFTDILRRIGVASKVISAKVQKAGIVDVLGAHGAQNVQGEEQQKLDVMANEVMKSTFHWMPAIGGIATEEEEDFTVYPARAQGEGDRYLVLFDPLDGSSNIDANVSVGTIFSIHKLDSPRSNPTVEDFLKPGNKQVSAGYVIYGSSTMFVFTTGHGVHGFTLDPEVGEYVLSHEDLKIPDVCKCFSANEANYSRWDEPTRKFADRVRYSEEERYAKSTSRYIGSLVADSKNRNGKLRLLYECAPMAMIIEQAGGLATTGKIRVMDVVPTELHQRVPLIIGGRTEVELYEKMIAEAGEQ